MEEWFADTDRRKLVGEAGVPMLSVLQAFFMGSRMKSIVQCGHYAGYSSLLIGFMLRKMNVKNGLFTIDIDPQVSEYTASWIRKAGLSEYVHVEISDSISPELPGKARRWFGGPVQNVIIDSSHQYMHTLRELEMWYGELTQGGMMFLHDTSERSRAYDITANGGVKRALQELSARNPSISYIDINTNIDDRPEYQPAYVDWCGLCIIHKSSNEIPYKRPSFVERVRGHLRRLVDRTGKKVKRGLWRLRRAAGRARASLS